MLEEKNGPGERPLKLPTFGSVLRHLRDSRGISRERLARGAHLSVSYVTHIETDDRDRRPTRTVVEALLAALDLVEPVGDADRRHLFDLARVAELDSPSAADLSAALPPDLRRGLVQHDPNPAAYLDTRSNVLDCNESYDRTFTGLLDNGNILRWVFADERSKQALVEWEYEARLTVGLVRGFIGRSDNPHWWSELLEELSEYPDFRRIWDDNETVFGRDVLGMHLRDPAGRESRLDLQVFQVDSVEYHDRLLFVLGLPAVANPE
ncbi:helix-turn-helix transcriptional regulator [Nocardia inohanensis]|uniref:helix-turn-helix transcriptional regulator n=1 Tax=Nocardia inohanensis TaxID=209246 RepID=UPI000A437203|nr:helix-turn-helix transcriptional regulator [Nocardia inohanensis]